MGPKSNMTGVLIRREELKETHRSRGGKGHVTEEAEIGVMQLQAKKCQGLPEVTRSYTEARKDPALSLQTCVDLPAP